MQSLKDRRAMIVSHMNMEEEDDLNHEHLCESDPNSQNEILHLPDVCSLLKNSQVDVNSSLQKEFFSLKIRNCSLFKAVPLPHIGKKMPPHLSEPRLNLSAAVSSKDSSHLLFSPERGRLDKVFNHFDSTSVIDWLEKAYNSISDLGVWCCTGDNFVHFAHFWLSELQYNQKRQLLELEMDIIEDELQLAFLEKLDSELEPSDLHSILAATLSEYPMGLLSNQKPCIFLDYLNVMSSEQTTAYKKMLSSIKYTTNNPQFYKALVSTRFVPELHIKSSVSATTKQTNEVVKERALHSVQLGYADVLHYLIINQQLDLGAVDEKNRNFIFLATIYDQPKILDYFLDMGLPIPDVNHAAENGNTPLHAAVNTGKMHLVSLLLHYPGINVNFPNPQCNGATALHLAIVYGYLGICYLLLNAAADVESPLGDLTPVQLAENFGNETITKFIKMHIKKLKLENKMFA
ncbi:protein FAM220A isoform X2 [Chelonoidis abingdonii]|uniref:protein FAM220A isoform X2 n=1 Tax=Chelonoidis abingdonii TaxID=106734 RepID=UPI0013F22C78|nr:protein FAM220A isoform X2 [Chelonoidis abingdonii]